MIDTPLLDQLILKMEWTTLTSFSSYGDNAFQNFSKMAAAIIAFSVALFVATWFLLEEVFKRSLKQTGRLQFGLVGAILTAFLLMGISPLLNGTLWNATFGEPLQFLAMASLSTSGPPADFVPVFGPDVIDQYRQAAIDHVKDTAAQQIALESVFLIFGILILRSVYIQGNLLIPRGDRGWFLSGLVLVVISVIGLSDQALWAALDGNPEPLLSKILVSPS